ncbi:hypothetical protein FKM82_023840 [Ascaphus truei]
MIAAFWADADLSGGIGEMYYQVYDFQASPTTSDAGFKVSLENAINDYFGSSLEQQFNALWAVKITWENVPPSTSQYYTDRYWDTYSSSTNTYQVVLATDGVYSFSLILFEDGGMRWRYFALPTQHQPIMGYYSGIPRPRNTNNFPAFNDPQTEPSVSIEQRYTPDQYKGHNTGKNGQWAYRLDSNTQSSKNTRLQCLSWYYKETAPSSLLRTPPCPCTYSQAVFDSSFTNGFRIWNYDFELKSSSDQYLSVQSVFPSRSGAGTRCYYSWSGALIYGEKERYLPTPWTYFDFWSYRSNPQTYMNYYWNNVLTPQRRQYKDGEVDPYNVCCKDSGSNYLCSLYRQKRPLDHCEQYVPPRIGFLFGDPHINTLDGLKYTFNGLGEFILANVKDENNTEVFRLQGRTAKAGNGTSNATNFVGLAASTSTGAQVQWNLLSDNETLVTFNGSIIPLTENIIYIDHVALERTVEGETKASFSIGISLSVSVKLGTLSFVVTLQPTYQNRTEGLLGVYNGNPNDDLLSADGHTIPYNESTKLTDAQIFIFGITWKTTSESSIFVYNTTAGESWDTYNNNSFVPMFYDDLISTSDPETLQKANDTCKGNTDCIFDILSTGDFELGSATLNSDTIFTDQRDVMKNFPPNISGPSTIRASLMVQVLVDYRSSDDSAWFTLETTSTDLEITGNGTLSWLPTSTAPVFAVLRANNSRATQELALTLTLCNCSNNGACHSDIANLKGERNSSRFMTAACTCPAAWAGEFCTDDFNACWQNSCFNTSTCVDNAAPVEGYQCGPCPKGLRGEGIKCSDIDECYGNTADCDQICINTLAGYNCSCNAGFQPNQHNASSCEDINECMNPSSCVENATCTNIPGNYSCTCADGYSGNPYLLCTDINECLTPSTNLCSNTSVCINTNGSYYCECLLGFNGPNCTDILYSTTTPGSTTRATFPTSQANSASTLKTTLGQTSTALMATHTASVFPVTLTESASTVQSYPESTSTGPLSMTSSPMQTSYMPTPATEVSLTDTATSQGNSYSSPAQKTTISSQNIPVDQMSTVVASTSLDNFTTSTSSAPPLVTRTNTTSVTTVDAAGTSTFPTTSPDLQTNHLSTSGTPTTITSSSISSKMSTNVSSTYAINSTANASTLSSQLPTMENITNAATYSSTAPQNTSTTNNTTSQMTTLVVTNTTVDPTTASLSPKISPVFRITTNLEPMTKAASATKLESTTENSPLTHFTPETNNYSTLLSPSQTHSATVRTSTILSGSSAASNITFGLPAISTESTSTVKSYPVLNTVSTIPLTSHSTFTSTIEALVTNATISGQNYTSTSEQTIISGKPVSRSEMSTPTSSAKTTTVVSTVTSPVSTAITKSEATMKASSTATLLTSSQNFQTTQRTSPSASTTAPAWTEMSTGSTGTHKTTSTLKNVTEERPTVVSIPSGTTIETSASSVKIPTPTTSVKSETLIHTTTTSHVPTTSLDTHTDQTSVTHIANISSSSSKNNQSIPGSPTTHVNIENTSTAQSSMGQTAIVITNATQITTKTSPSAPTTKVNVTSFVVSAASSTKVGRQTTPGASSCGAGPCPTGFCSNGGTCSINVTSCTPTCKCAALFTDNRCILAGNNFTPEPYKEIPRRVVEINLWIKGENGSSLTNTSSQKYIRLQQDVNATASLYLQTLVASQENSRVWLSDVAGRAHASVTSGFRYRNNRTIIDFLNQDLVAAIVHAFNTKLTARRRRQARVSAFFYDVFDKNITNIANLSASELETYFSCNRSGFSGYDLEYNSDGFTCVSPCKKNYCQNDAVCEHREAGPSCRCAEFSIYTPSGERCENLSINLGAFFGILFGSLAFVVLIAAISILIAYCCKKKSHSAARNLNFHWQSTSFSSVTKMKETRLAGNPELKSWTPNLENVPVAPQVKIQRPSLHSEPSSVTNQ